tara:strand:+ start:144 stop:803 length:660 start_codon:yes stop_codon:yes gene_type:complete
MTKYYPSEDYYINLNYYKDMHENGYQLIDGRKRISKDAYDGKSTLAFAPIIKEIIKNENIENMIDYGCGKGNFYNKSFNLGNKHIPPLSKYWDIDIKLYDPCFEKYSKFEKDEDFDLTICIDVLEHIPKIDIEWILDRFFKISKKFIFINVACYEAIALLPDGRNAHINVQEPIWWSNTIEKLIKNHKGVKVICICTIKDHGKIKHIPLEYGCKIKDYL